MGTTVSEIEFAKFCSDNGIRCEQIPTESGAGRKTPDYYIYPAGEKIVVEVKEIQPNREEREQERQLQKMGWSTFSASPGARVRDMIETAGKQIRMRAKGVYPALLVLHNPSFLLRHHTESYAIKVAMYGFDSVLLGLPADMRESPLVIDRKSGPRRKMTPTTNTSIGAVAVLEAGELRIFHNIYAAILLRPELFRGMPVRQFTLAEKEPGRFQELIEIPV